MGRTKKDDPRAPRFYKVYRRHTSNYNSAVHTARTDSISAQVADCKGDQRALFRLIGDLTGSVAPRLLPERPSLQVVVHEFSYFFLSRISSMRSDLDQAAKSISGTNQLGSEEPFLLCHRETVIGQTPIPYSEIRRNHRAD